METAKTNLGTNIQWIIIIIEIGEKEMLLYVNK